MQTKPTHEEPDRILSERERDVLKDVISRYIVGAEPVSSRAISKQHQKRLSSATIRNTMADLEDWGYLSQPHTSAGRIPTRLGYHFFIDALMKERVPAPQLRRYVSENLGRGHDAESLTLIASHLLSELSEQVGVVLTPALGEVVLRAIEFVPLPGAKVLCVIVSASGFIDNKVIETDECLPREQLTRISNYLTENFTGMSLAAIRTQLLKLMADERAQVSSFMQTALTLAQSGMETAHGQTVLVEGAEALLTKPELKDLTLIQRLFDAFADKAQLVTMLNRCIEGRGVRVLIGDDADLTSDLDFSLVATTYGVADQPVGSLGIFGPSRMEYQRLVPLVHFLGEALTSALTHEVVDGTLRQ
ncbi:MAG: heat-inducible transcriptional repressor HrcA [Acidobacteriota bacterium]|nr:heat-inducible transcriptional repressor HrcA [Acidobacteriota bacterium]